MGEAKRRRAADPNYGRPVRGLVVSQAIEIRGTSMLVKGVTLDPQELRLSLLFWDKLVWPSSRILGAAPSPEEDFLLKAGVLTRPDYTFDGDVAQSLARAYTQAFADLDRKQPGQWAMAHGESSLILHGVDTVVPDGGISVDLLRAVPVPDKDVPLEAVLEFKRKRSDELEALRSHIDGLLHSIHGGADGDAGLQAAVEAIGQACTDVLQSGGEWQFPMRLSTLKTTFELRPFQTISGALTGYAAGLALPGAAGLLASLAGAALATAPALKIHGDIGWRGLKREPSPFRYVSQFHAELF